ncbi:MAG: alginate lyase family protein [Candidatus Rokubacteria bacterium]|nr:alginate lyase family protein [Candidatus Rokubacteria bacterium]
MEPTELVFRGRQELAKRLERIGVIGRLRARPGAMLLDRFREAAPVRFFEGAVSARTRALIDSRMPGARGHVVAAAEAICRGRFALLGYRDLSFGDPVDWHLDPVSGRQAPLVHWSRLDPLDAATAGDCKVVWELNRHQWLVHLGQAYQLTDDERYARAFAGYVGDWLRANPPGQGINWTSSLEVALRLVSWCWALFLFRNARAFSPALFGEMLGAIGAHAAYVERNLSYYFSPNTHLTGEALGLFYAGVVFPEFRRARRWRTLGARILVEASARQILPDGVYFEQSTCYQRYTVETYLHFLILAARNGVPVAPDVAERVRRMLDFLLAVRRPDGSIPRIGDADGGRLLPLADRSPDDFQGLFATAAAVFGRPDYAWAAPAPAPEPLWLLGPAGLDVLETLRPAPPPTAPSRLFAEGGYAVMRGGWDAHAHHLIFDAGPLGCGLSDGHGHADLLSIQASVFGTPYLVDAGTYCYTADREWRDFFRGTAAHSTVLVDGVGQARPAGPFRWESRPRGRVRRWVSTAAFDFVDAEHDAYRRLPDPVLHRRRVLFVKPRYWVVVDDLEGGAEHRVELRFQFGPMPVAVDPALWARARGPEGHGLLIRPFATVPLKADIIEGEIAPIQGWVSPDYGQRQPAPVLTYSTVTRLPIRIMTLLFPVENPSVGVPAISALVGKGPGPVGLLFGGGQEWVRFGGLRGVTVQ